MQISSVGQKILVVGDVHQDILRLKRIINYEQADKVVCVGDWFDSFTYDTTEALLATCKMLKDYIPTNRILSCLGNHDLPYFYDNVIVWCTGYRESKHNLVKDAFGTTGLKRIANQFHWHIWVDDYLVTHAGLHPHFLHPYVELLPKHLDNWLSSQGMDASAQLLAKSSHWFYRAGEARGGRQKFGGLVWLDFHKEFEPIPGLKQIFGHSSVEQIYYDTPILGPVKHVLADNFNIDCGLTQYLVIQDKQVQIKKTKDIV